MSVCTVITMFNMDGNYHVTNNAERNDNGCWGGREKKPETPQTKPTGKPSVRFTPLDATGVSSHRV